MNTNTKRRVFLKGSLAAGTVGVAVGAGLLTPQAVVAAWNEKAFQAKSIGDALNAAMGASSETGPGALPDVSTRIKMGKTSDVIAVVKAGGKLHSARKSVKVTIGGCGG